MTEVGDDQVGLQYGLAGSDMVERDHVARDMPWRPPWNPHVLASATNAVLQGRQWCGRSDVADKPNKQQRWEQMRNVSALALIEPICIRGSSS